MSSCRRPPNVVPQCWYQCKASHHLIENFGGNVQRGTATSYYVPSESSVFFKPWRFGSSCGTRNASRVVPNNSGWLKRTAIARLTFGASVMKVLSGNASTVHCWLTLARHYKITNISLGVTGSRTPSDLSRKLIFELCLSSNPRKANSSSTLFIVRKRALHAASIS